MPQLITFVASDASTTLKAAFPFIKVPLILLATSTRAATVIHATPTIVVSGPMACLSVLEIPSFLSALSAVEAFATIIAPM